MDDLLKSILEVQSHSGKTRKMNKLICKLASDFGGTVKVKDKSIYVTKGAPTANGYPCVVSHTDTVHKILPEGQYKVIHDAAHGVVYGYNPVKREFAGIGGDDKNGIYVALYAIRELPSVKAVFFRDEEIGCVGSNNADLSFFKDCMYALQCDRRGNNDFVTSISGTELSSQEFQEDILDIISQHGYKFTTGMTTDVGALAKKNVGISVANMSAGYYNPHTDEEIIDIADLYNCRDMCMSLFYTLDKAYPFTPPVKVYTPPANYYSSSNFHSSKNNTSTNVENDLFSMSDAEWEAYYEQKYGKSNDGNTPPKNSYFKAPQIDPIKIKSWTVGLDDFITDDNIDSHIWIIAYGWSYEGNGIYAKSFKTRYGNKTTFLEMYKFDIVNMQRVASTEERVLYNEMIEDYINWAATYEEEVDGNIADPKIDCCDNCNRSMLATELDNRYHCCDNCLRDFGLIY